MGASVEPACEGEVFVVGTDGRGGGADQQRALRFAILERFDSKKQDVFVFIARDPAADQPLVVGGRPGRRQGLEEIGRMGAARGGQNGSGEGNGQQLARGGLRVWQG